MLYHPLKDANHCCYRLLSILIAVDDFMLIDRLKIIDFYYLFPYFLKSIDPWPMDISKYKKIIKDLAEPYEILPSKAKLFFDLNRIQNQSIYYLASKEIIYIVSVDNSILINKEKVPTEILECIKNDYFFNGDLFQVITKGLVVTKWAGPSGLKKRSGLMEYKYDE